MSGSSRSNPVKVVMINTQYVETDAMSFKSVVQRFTGKDAKIELRTGSGFKEKPLRFQYGVQMLSEQEPVMSRGLSFKDLDTLMRELPPPEDLYRFCAD